MSDTWYRNPPAIPPYEDWQGGVWTWDGVCLNPVHTCEPPQWHHDLAWFDLESEIAFGYREAVDAFMREHLGEWMEP
jgi:hypothetical protein